MSTPEQMLEARLRLLSLADELRNVSLACRQAGVSRSHFYELRQAYRQHGEQGLLPRPRRRPRMPNQTPPEIEARILEMTQRDPRASYVRVSEMLRTAGVPVSPSAVRYVWQRHGLRLRGQRIAWLEEQHSKPAAATGAQAEGAGVPVTSVSETAEANLSLRP